MNDEKSVMEKIVCRSEPITTGFEFRWTIDRKNGFLSLSQPLQSPVFKALQWNWTIGTEHITKHYSRNWIEHNLDISLNLVDAKSNKIEEIPDHPFFNTNKVSVTVSFLKEDGKILMGPQVKKYTESLKERFNKPLINFLLDDKTLSFVVHSHENIQLLFDLQVLNGVNKKVQVNGGRLGGNEGSTFSMRKLFSEGKFTDFIIRTGDRGEIRAHRAILNNSSRYFEAMFELGGVEFQRGELEVPESHAVMVELVRFLYTGELPNEIQGDYGGVEMYIASDKYQVEELKDHFESAVDSYFSVENVCAELARAHIGGIECLKTKAAGFIRAHRKEVVETEGWTELCGSHPKLVAFLFVQ